MAVRTRKHIPAYAAKIWYLCQQSINKVILVGNVGKDPELKYSPNATPVAKFSLASAICTEGFSRFPSSFFRVCTDHSEMNFFLGHCCFSKFHRNWFITYHPR
jgi:single-stranded DNA-binding protein